MTTTPTLQHANTATAPAKENFAGEYAPFLFLIAIGGATPLVIHWSMDGGLPVTFMVFVRFAIAGLIAAALLFKNRRRLTFDRRLLTAWLAAGVPSSIAMVVSYWLLQRINSGTVAIYLGVIPMMTGLLAWAWLRDRPSMAELACLALGAAGLTVIFQDSLQSGSQTWIDIGAGLLCVFLMASSSVLLKRVSKGLPADAINHGALIVRCVLTGLAWLAVGAPLPDAMPSALACGATLFMAVVGSIVAFTVHIRQVQRFRPMTNAAITEITPVLSLWLGHALNSEAVTSAQLLGTAVVLAGLGLYLVQQQRRQAAPRR